MESYPEIVQSIKHPILDILVHIREMPYLKQQHLLMEGIHGITEQTTLSTLTLLIRLTNSSFVVALTIVGSQVYSISVTPRITVIPTTVSVCAYASNKNKNKAFANAKAFNKYQQAQKRVVIFNTKYDW